MLIETLLAILIGIVAGIFTGLMPGLHVNLVALLLVSSAAHLSGIFSLQSICVIIISTAITHTFLDAIPGIYLGAPDESMAMGALPGHRLLLQGKGYIAVMCTLVGSLGSVIFGVIFFCIFALAIKLLYPIIRESTGYLLVAVVIYLIVIELSWRRRILSLVFFVVAGMLGYAVFSLEMNQPLFPLLSGLFGISLLLNSVQENTKIVKQSLASELTLPRKNMAKALFASSFTGFIAAFLPGFGSSQAAVLGKEIVGDLGDEGFLMMIGGINTANMLLSIATFFMIDKARNGAIVGVQELIGEIGINEVVLFISVSLIAAGTAVLIALRVTRLFSRMMSKVNYPMLVWSIIIITIIMSIVFDTILGLIVILVSTAVGYIASKNGIAKSHLLGCLILPVILYFLT